MKKKQLTPLKKFFIILFITIISISTLCCFTSAAIDKKESLLVLNDTFTLKIPKSFTYEKADYVLNSEITQHYILEGKDGYAKINGFIQVRNLSVSLADYIKQSEENFSAALYDYEKKPVLQNGSIGLDIKFKVNGPDYDTQVMQALWQRKNTLFLINLSAKIENNNYSIIEKAFNELKSTVTLTGDSLPSGKLTEYYTCRI